MKTVYMCFATDVIHEGHMNVVKKAKEYGKVVAGVLCDAERWSVITVFRQ